jgi:hypothetical protein
MHFENTKQIARAQPNSLSLPRQAILTASKNHHDIHQPQNQQEVNFLARMKTIEPESPSYNQ